MRKDIYYGYIIRGSGDEATLREHVAHAEQAVKGYRAVQLGGIDRLSKKPLTTKQVQDLEDRIIRAETHAGEMKKALELYRAAREAPYRGPSRTVDLAMAAGGRTGAAEAFYDQAMAAGEAVAFTAVAVDRSKCHVCAKPIPPGAGHHTAAYSFDTYECMRGFCE